MNGEQMLESEVLRWNLDPGNSGESCCDWERLCDTANTWPREASGLELVEVRLHPRDWESLRSMVGSPAVLELPAPWGKVPVTPGEDVMRGNIALFAAPVGRDPKYTGVTM